MCFINIHITKRKLSNHRLCYFLADKQSFRSTFRAQFVEAKKWLRSDNQRRFIRGMSKMAVIRVLLVNSDIYLCGSSIDYCSNLFCQVCLRHYEQELIELACNCPVVVCCRCSPQQKADIVTLLKKHTGKRTCAIGEIIKMNHCVSCIFLGAICMLPSTIWWCAAEQIHLSLKSFFSTIGQLHDGILLLLIPRFI